MTRERISRSTRTARGLVRCSYPSRATTLLPFRRSAACIIAMSVELRKMGEAARAVLASQSRQIDFLSKDRGSMATNRSTVHGSDLDTVAGNGLLHRRMFLTAGAAAAAAVAGAALPNPAAADACPWRIRKSTHKCVGPGSLVRICPDLDVPSSHRFAGALGLQDAIFGGQPPSP
jgi:hypothetical protein